MVSQVISCAGGYQGLLLFFMRALPYSPEPCSPENLWVVVVVVAAAAVVVVAAAVVVVVVAVAVVAVVVVVVVYYITLWFLEWFPARADARGCPADAWPAWPAVARHIYIYIYIYIYIIERERYIDRYL